MARIGLLGLGTVGSGVYEIINEKKGNFFEDDSTLIKKILVSDVTKKRSIEVPKDLLTEDFDEILNDEEIDIVCCVMGSYEREYDCMKKALMAKKHVATANKEIISRHLEELLSIANENGVNLLFEASVGGGIPIIESIVETLKINKINKIQGILNGTTNYIVSKMTNEEKDFLDVLKTAQEMGFAEADPTSDVDGFDIARKLTILSSLCYGSYIDYEDIYTRGIRNITLADVQMADDMGYVFKYLADSKLYDDESFEGSVAPVLLNKQSVVSNVNEEYNIVTINGNIIGELSFLGKGAGKEATANAVVSDIIKIVKKNSDYSHLNFDKKLNSLGISKYFGRFYVRVSIEEEKEFNKCIDILSRNLEINNLEYSGGKIFLVTKEISGQEMSKLYDMLIHDAKDVFYARIVEDIL